MNTNPSHLLARVFAWAVVAVLATFLLNNYLIFWQGWPGVVGYFSDSGPAEGQAWLAQLQVFSYALAVVAALVYVLMKKSTPLQRESDRLAALAGYIVRAAFWAVLLIGVTDVAISWLRVEGLLELWFGEELDKSLARSQYRGTYVHYPLILLSCVIAGISRSLGFIWLALLVVMAEFLIVISRFVFSYEKSFMGDLVRFWYAALFLFASAHTLVIEGHVRVDVVYERLSEKARAIANIVGVLLLGLPLCWLILVLGMSSKGSSINSPLLTFEITQSGYGMYVKYLMVGFLLIFAVSMIVQFCAYLLSNLSRLTETASESVPVSEEQEVA